MQSSYNHPFIFFEYEFNLTNVSCCANIFLISFFILALCAASSLLAVIPLQNRSTHFFNASTSEISLSWSESISEPSIWALRNKDCEDLYYKASDKIESLNKTITIKDSIENNLRNTIVNKDNVISLKDDIIKNKDSEIELVKSLGKKRDKKYSVSIQLGTGAAVTKNINSINAQFVPIYVGIGISRNIFSF